MNCYQTDPVIDGIRLTRDLPVIIATPRFARSIDAVAGLGAMTIDLPLPQPLGDAIAGAEVLIETTPGLWHRVTVVRTPVALLRDGGAVEPNARVAVIDPLDIAHIHDRDRDSFIDVRYLGMSATGKHWFQVGTARVPAHAITSFAESGITCGRFLLESDGRWFVEELLSGEGVK